MAVGETNPELILSTLDKGLRILEVLAAQEGSRGPTLTELGRLLGMHRTTLLRFLTTLRARGYVERDAATDRYRLGLQVLVLSSRLLNSLDIRSVAGPALRALRDETQELVQLTVLDRGDVITVELVAAPHALSLQTDIGERRPAYCTASGKAMLAYLPPDEVAPILARGMPRMTPTTIVTPAAMEAHLAGIRRDGLACDDEERIAGVRCVGAPVFGHEGRVLAAVSVAAPSQRLTRERMAEFGGAVRATANEISRQLGYTSALADEGHTWQLASR